MSPVKRQILELAESFPEVRVIEVNQMDMALKFRNASFGHWFEETTLGGKAWNPNRVNLDGNAGRPRLLLKVPFEKDSAFFKPQMKPYQDWLGVWMDVDLARPELEELIRRAYETTAPKKYHR